MIKLTRYSMENGNRFGDKTEELSKLAAFAALTSFLAAGKMSACLEGKPASLLFWREGPLSEDFACFEGAAEELADLAKLFRLNNDNDELRDALRERFCSETLPNLLWLRTSSSLIGGPSYRMICFMYMAGITNLDDYTHTSGVVHNVDQMMTAIELWQGERDAGRDIGLWEILKPVGKAA